MQNLSSAARSTAQQPAPGTQASPARTLPSADLLQGGRSVDINHNGAVYRLQATKLGKLILTK
ncbi:MAG: hemin uptake protein HemP [Haliea sp.]|nr:MAG: hemin uptake protein HemP [Haliea sp.]